MPTDGNVVPPGRYYLEFCTEEVRCTAIWNLLGQTEKALSLRRAATKVPLSLFSRRCTSSAVACPFSYSQASHSPSWRLTGRLPPVSSQCSEESDSSGISGVAAPLAPATRAAAPHV